MTRQGCGHAPRGFRVGSALCAEEEEGGQASQERPLTGPWGGLGGRDGASTRGDTAEGHPWPVWEKDQLTPLSAFKGRTLTSSVDRISGLPSIVLDRKNEDF